MTFIPSTEHCMTVAAYCIYRGIEKNRTRDIERYKLLDQFFKQPQQPYTKKAVTYQNLIDAKIIPTVLPTQAIFKGHLRHFLAEHTNDIEVAVGPTSHSNVLQRMHVTQLALVNALELHYKGSQDTFESMYTVVNAAFENIVRPQRG